MRHYLDFEKPLAELEAKINELQFVFKKECFRHEEEIRAILYIPQQPLLIDETEFSVKYRNSHGYIVPYVEYPVMKDAVVRITVAPLLQADLAIKNLSEMLQKRGCNNVKIKSSDVPIRF